MRKCLYLILLFVIGSGGSLFAQERTTPNVIPSGKHTYFIYIQGANTRTDVVNLESSINQKAGIKYFMARRFPVMYFSLVTDNVITESEFSSWLDPNLYRVEIYGEGEKHQGMCVTKYKKSYKY